MGLPGAEPDDVGGSCSSERSCCRGAGCWTLTLGAFGMMLLFWAPLCCTAGGALCSWRLNQACSSALAALILRAGTLHEQQSVIVGTVMNVTHPAWRAAGDQGAPKALHSWLLS